MRCRFIASIAVFLCIVLGLVLLVRECNGFF